MANPMHVGSFDAYIIDDNKSHYYLFWCTSEPKEADKDTVFQLDENEFVVKKGLWYFEVAWLDKIPDISMWYTIMEQRWIVCGQVVVGADVELTRWSKDNPFCKNLRKGIANKAKTDGAVNVADAYRSCLWSAHDKWLYWPIQTLFTFFLEMESELVAKEELSTIEEEVEEMSNKEN